MIELQPAQLEEIKQILSPLAAKGYAFYAFGSRVKAQARNYSDLDLLVQGAEPLPKQELYQLQESFAESDLPFRVDISDAAKISDSFKRCIESELVKVL